MQPVWNPEMSWSHKTMTNIFNFSLNYISAINQQSTNSAYDSLCLSSAAWLEGFLGLKGNETKLEDLHVIPRYTKIIWYHLNMSGACAVAMVSMATMYVSLYLWVSTCLPSSFPWFSLEVLPLWHLQGSFAAIYMDLSSVLISGQNGEMTVEVVGFTSCAFASTHAFSPWNIGGAWLNSVEAKQT